VSLVAAAALTLAPFVAAAGGGAETDPYDDVPAPARWWLGGLGDFYVLHNFNSPASGTNQLRQFDLHSDVASVGLVRVTLACKPRRIGFRIDTAFGDTADAFYAQDPEAAQHPDVARWFSHVEQAFVSVVVPAARPIAVDVGKLNTPVGLEDNEAPTNWSYSRGLLFAFAEPTLHTGVRVTVAPAPTVGVSLYWVNGWNANFLDGSDLRTWAAALTWRPRAGLEIVLVYIGGWEHPPSLLADPHLTLRNLGDGYVVWTPLRWLSVAASGDYGDDRARGGVSFWGVAGYALARPTAWSWIAVRGEYLGDPDGFATGTRQSVTEETVTAALQGHLERLALGARFEYRHDSSSAFVFERFTQPAGARDQHTLTLALLVGF